MIKALAHDTNGKPLYIFDRAVLRAVRKYRYNPKIEHGKAVSQPGQQLQLTFSPPQGGR